MNEQRAAMANAAALASQQLQAVMEHRRAAEPTIWRHRRDDWLLLIEMEYQAAAAVHDALDAMQEAT